MVTVVCAVAYVSYHVGVAFAYGFYNAFGPAFRAALGGA